MFTFLYSVRVIIAFTRVDISRSIAELIEALNLIFRNNLHVWNLIS